jgi:hypothetical protein
MSTSDFLKAALEKKKAQQDQKSGKGKNLPADKVAVGNQVTTNRPTKKSSGRGR